MTPAQPVHAVLKAIVWTLAWLLLLDVGTHFAVRRIAQHHPDSSLVRYFQYGLSIETKLDEATRLPRNAPDALILSAGWLDPDDWQALPERPQPGTDKLLAMYGQSFAFNVTHAAMQLDGHLTLRGIGGPAAPPDHSYAAYLADEGNGHADVVLFGILASSVARMGSMTGMDWTFEHPAPFTFPRYRLHDGRLEAEAPIFHTEQQFRDAFAQRSTQWQAFKDQLARNDRGFDPVTFDRTWLDKSQIALLMRRGWVAHDQDYNAGVYDSSRGFAPDSEQMRALKAMLIDLAARTRARGQRLIVLLEQDQGYGDSLDRALGPTLTAAKVEYISSHTVFSANDPRNFQSDGHYTAQANELFARQLQALIRSPSAAP
jgi:hypothetical protein